MERADCIRHFSERLVKLMLQAGFSSPNSKVAVKVSQLAKISNCSIPMARRYVMGSALPDINTIYKIAAWMKVSPAWLLFGEDHVVSPFVNLKTDIHIETKLLEYILDKSAVLFRITSNTKELVGYILDIIHDVTQIDATDDTLQKVVDMSISSIIRIKGSSYEEKTV